MPLSAHLPFTAARPVLLPRMRADRWAIPVNRLCALWSGLLWRRGPTGQPPVSLSATHPPTRATLCVSPPSGPHTPGPSPSSRSMQRLPGRSPTSAQRPSSRALGSAGFPFTHIKLGKGLGRARRVLNHRETSHHWRVLPEKRLAAVDAAINTPVSRAFGGRRGSGTSFGSSGT
jgi:hypothetical protein